MSDYVTRADLTAAISAVEERIDETEQRLRTEFTSALRYEMSGVNNHLSAQDETLKWINRWTLGALLSVIVALIYLIR